MCDRYHDSNSLPTIGCGTTRRAIDVVFFPQLLELLGVPGSLLSLLLCFPCFSAFVLLCLSMPFYFCYSTFSFFQSCVFAALLPAPLLLAASCLYCSVCVCHFLLLYSLLFVS